MPILTDLQISEIAEQLEIGFRCFWRKTTGELLFVPDFTNNPDWDTELFEEELEKLEDNFLDYQEIAKPDTRYSFEIMENFAEQLNDNYNLKSELFRALNGQKPFRVFKFVIDNSGEYRQKWFDFKSKNFENWVKEQLENN